MVVCLSVTGLRHETHLLETELMAGAGGARKEAYGATIDRCEVRALGDLFLIGKSLRIDTWHSRIE